jgi:hypothetical protein
MQHTFSVSGTPGQIATTLANQIKVAADEQPKHTPVLVNARDYVSQEVAALGLKGDETATVTITLAVSVVKDAAKGQNAPAGTPLGGGTEPQPIADAPKSK